MIHSHGIAFLLVAALLGGCATTGGSSPGKARPSSGLEARLPTDADRDRMPEQRVLVERGYYYDRAGNLKPLDPSAVAEPACPITVEAHRGSQRYPENSERAVKAALDEGYAGVEVDAQLSVDGHWVIHHDAVLGRTVDAGRYTGKRVAQVPYRTLRRLRLKNSDGKRTRYYLPGLDDVVDAFADRAKPGQHLNIEVKGNYACPQLRDLHRQVSSRLEPEQIRYSSMDLGALRCLRSAAPDVYLGYVAAPDNASLDASSGGRYKKVRGALLKYAGYDIRRLGGEHRNEQVSLSSSGLQRLKRTLGGWAGVHADVRQLGREPALIRRMRGEGLALFSYTINGTGYHLSTLRRLPSSARRQLSGAISDSKPEQVCRAAR